jgi:hypothetical protein
VTERALGLGALHVLSKPIDSARLADEVCRGSPGATVVLVVDDERDLCENLWDLLHERGYRVCLAHGEAEAAGRLRVRGRAYRVVIHVA